MMSLLAIAVDDAFLLRGVHAQSADLHDPIPSISASVPVHVAAGAVDQNHALFILQCSPD